MRSRVTLKDVARHVGVSVNAASKVLNHTLSSGKVSEATRGRIEAAALELGYQPNSLARSLVRRRADIVGLYFDYELNLTEPFSANLVEGAEIGCKERQQALLIYSRRRDETIDDVCRRLLSGVVDGLAIPGWTANETIDRLCAAGMPIVQYGYIHPELPSVVIDERSGAEQIAAHLAGKGHTWAFYRACSVVANLREQCQHEMAHKYGLRLDGYATDNLGNITPEEIELLARPAGSRPTAAICWNDQFAYRLLEYCEQIGLRVPEDLAIVGFDRAATFPGPKMELTTVFAPWIDMARLSISLLVDIRDGNDVLKDTILPVELRIGNTT